MLPCLHRFCTECLKKQLDRQLNNFNQLQPAGADRRPDQYRCPLDHCKALTGIDFHDDPLHDGDLPRTDEFLEKMVELFKLEECLANREKLCDVCKSGNRQRAVCVCRCRNIAFCEDCADHHTRERAALGEVVQLSVQLLLEAFSTEAVQTRQHLGSLEELKASWISAGEVSAKLLNESHHFR